jgi:hypothetical protein
MSAVVVTAFPVPEHRAEVITAFEENEVEKSVPVHRPNRCSS